MQRFTSKTSQLKNLIIDNIKSGYFLPGDKLPAERELVDKYPISRIIAQNALRELAEAGIINRTRRKGSFVSDTARDIIARMEDMEHAGKILKVGVILRQRLFNNNIYDYFFRIFVDNLPPRTSVKFYFHDYPRKDIYASDNIDILIIDDGFHDEEISILDGLKSEKVILFRESENYNFAAPDNFRGGQLAGKYLTGKGHRRVACFQFREGYSDTELQLRARGIQRGVITSGGEVVPVPILSVSEVYSTRASVEFLFAKDPDFTAISALTDHMAMKICEVLFAMGHRIPEDISVIGYDDIFFASRMRTPLTTIRQPWGGIVRRLIESITQYLDTGKIDIREKIVPEVVERSSVRTLCCPTENNK